MKIIHIIQIALALLTAMNVNAQQGVGNGGKAVREENGKYYLLDLVEAGVEKTASEILAGSIQTFQSTVNKERVWPNYLKWNIDSLEQTFGKEVAMGFAATLASLQGEERDYILAGALLYSWSFINVDLKSIGDDRTNIDTSKYPLSQVAVRRDRTIQVQRQIYNSFDLANKVALIFHEILYAYLVPHSDPLGHLNQYSWDARQIVGDLFRSNQAPAFGSYRRNQKPVLSFVSDSQIYSNADLSMVYTYASNSGISAVVENDTRITIQDKITGRLELGWYHPENKDLSAWAKNMLEVGCQLLINNKVYSTLVSASYHLAQVKFIDLNSTNGITQGLARSQDQQRQLKDIDDSKGRRGEIKVSFSTLNECKKAEASAMIEIASLLYNTVNGPGQPVLKNDLRNNSKSTLRSLSPPLSKRKTK